MHGFVVRIALRQHMPLSPGIENPKHGFKNVTGGNRFTTRMALGAMLLRKAMTDPFPLLVGQSNHTVMVHHHQSELKVICSDFEIGSSHAAMPVGPPGPRRSCWRWPNSSTKTAIPTATPSTRGRRPRWSSLGDRGSVPAGSRAAKRNRYDVGADPGRLCHEVAIALLFCALGRHGDRRPPAPGSALPPGRPPPGQENSGRPIDTGHLL